MQGLRTSPERVANAIHARTEGVGLRATSRLIGTHADTITRWEKRLAKVSDDEERRALQQFPATFCAVVEIDCLYTKILRNKPAWKSRGWTTITIERSTRVMLSLECGDAKRIRRSVKRIHQACGQKLVMVSDGDSRFGNALLEFRLKRYFSGKAGRPVEVLKVGSQAVMKIKGSQDSKRRGLRVNAVRLHPETVGIADVEVHANHCEASNAMLRRRCSAFKRRTNQYAKTLQGLRRACCVQRVVHNWVRVHSGLGVGCTPAMVAGWAVRPLSFVELVMR